MRLGLEKLLGKKKVKKNCPNNNQIIMKTN